MLRGATDGHIRCLKEAINTGADVNFLEETSDTPEVNDYFSLSLLNLGFIEEPPSKTPLIHTVENNHVQFAELLIKEGANVNRTYTWGRSPLMVADEKGHYEIMEFLIVDVEYDENGQGRCVKMLIKAGADVDLQTYHLTALMLAAKNGHSGCVELLMKVGADVNNTDDYDCTAYEHAVNNGHDNCCHLLKKEKSIEDDKSDTMKEKPKQQEENF